MCAGSVSILAARVCCLGLRTLLLLRSCAAFYLPAAAGVDKQVSLKCDCSV
jgi:hypothetical protein